MPDTDLLRRFLLPALGVLLVAVWLAGGVTEDSSAADEFLQLLALPVLALAASVLLLDGVEPRLQRAAIAAAVLIALVPALQLLPLSPTAWNASPERASLHADLAAAGVLPVTRWSLAPDASERALWALLPALAAFLAALALPAEARRWLLKGLLLLVLGNVLFAFFQVGLPRDSALRLYQDFDAGFGGLLANTNHQATALIIGMVVAVGLAIQAWRRQQIGRSRPQAWAWYAAVAAVCLLLVPLSTARAGMAIALPALVAVLLLGGALPLRRLGRSKRNTALVLGLGALAVIGVRAAMGWMAIDQAEELRHTMAAATSAMAAGHAPLGSGIGSFVPVFAQGAPPALQLANYVNHAHNEYAQWWLEAGWLGLLALAAALAVLAAAGWHIVRACARDGHAILAGSCFVAICAVLAHSWADYPLRTTTLMATTAALAGLMLGALADSARTRRTSARAQDLATAD